MAQAITTKQAAAEIGVTSSAVIQWGKAGLFKLYDVSAGPDSRRRTYRVDRESWESFKASRVERPPAPVQRAKRTEFRFLS